MQHLTRRTWLGSVAALTLGCADLLQGMAPTYRTTASGSNVHAYQAAAFVFSFADGEAAQTQATLKKARQEIPTFLAQLKQSGHRLKLGVVDDNRFSIKTYELKFAIAVGDQEFSLPGKAGSDEEQYDRVLAELVAASGLDGEVVKQAHFAMYALANIMTTHNVSHDSLQKIAFQKLLIIEKLNRGQTQVDPFDPNRPKDESLADLTLALQLIEDGHRQISARRADVLAMLAVLAKYDSEGAVDAFKDLTAASLKEAAEFRAERKRPTAEDYGVAPAALPSPLSINKAIEEKIGFIGDLLKVAQGVITANPSMTLEGLAKLAPEDSSIQTALEGLSAATSGDIVGTIDAVAELAGETEAVDRIKVTLGKLKDAKAAVEGGAETLKDGAKKLP